MNVMSFLVLTISLLPIVAHSLIATQNAYMWRKDCNTACQKADMDLVIAQRPSCAFNKDPIIIGSLTYFILKCPDNLASAVAAPETPTVPVTPGHFVTAPHLELEFDDDVNERNTVTPSTSSIASANPTPTFTFIASSTPTPTVSSTSNNNNANPTSIPVISPTSTPIVTISSSASVTPSPATSVTPEETEECNEPEFNRNVPWGVDEVDGNPYDETRSCKCSNYGSGVHVVVMDTGCKPINGGLCSSLREEGVCTDWHGHGSGVIQFIADPKYGVAPNSDVSCWSMRYTYEDYLKGIQWAIDNGARVINMSFSWKMQHWSADKRKQVENILNPAVEELANLYGIYVVNTPGNTQRWQRSCNSCFNSPSSAQAEKLFTIQSHDAIGKIARSSCYGNCTDLSAPGAWVRALGKTGTERSFSGTSFAAPHVTGSIARLLSDGMEVSKSVLTSLGKDIVDNSGLMLKTLAVPCKKFNSVDM